MGHRPEKLDKPEAEVIEGLKKKSAQLLLTDFEHSYLEWRVESISGRRRSCWPYGMRERRFGSSVPAPTKASRAGGVGRGRRGITGLWSGPTWCASSAQDTAEIASSGETNGWLTTRRESSQFTTEVLVGRGTR